MGLGQSMRASRQLLARAARQQHAVTMRRTLITPTAVRQADLVQDMYLKELRPDKPTDAEGQVQKFTIPKAPQSPEEADLANDLKAYEDQVPEVEGQTTVASEAASVEQDWFEEPEEDEDEAHH